MNIAVTINDKKELRRIVNYIDYKYDELPDFEYLSQFLPITIALSSAEWSWGMQPSSKDIYYAWHIFNSKPADRIMTCNEFFRNTINSSNLLLII